MSTVVDRFQLDYVVELWKYASH